MSLSITPRGASRKGRFPISLNHPLDHKLIGYTAAASAAGVAMMALAQPSHAEIVYTPTHQRVTAGGSVALDLNNDGITDFTITSIFNPSCISGPECIYQELIVSPNGRNRVWITSGGQSYALALPAQTKVGPGGNFGLAHAKMDRCKATRVSYYVSGPWNGAKDLYLGLAFSIGGQPHYGWARLSVTVEGKRCDVLAVLTGYAYETVPGKAILTGRTSGTDVVSAVERPETTLGVLAQGSVGLVAWRRDEDAAHCQ